MGEEIERTFLVRNEEWRHDADNGTPMVQGYLSVEPRRTVRVRVRGDEAWLTVKGPNDGPRRREYEYPIPLDDGRELLEMCVPPVIDKRRHLLDTDEGTWEIDVFHGANDGLVLAEMELDDPHRSPAPTPWLGDEVTDDERYYNVNLVRHPYSRWTGHG